MADYFNGDESKLGNKVLPNGDSLKRKIDSSRDTFLKGIRSTKHGKKEDPTYLHFKFIFDFGNTSLIDPETFLAPSPLFRPMNKTAQTDKDLVNFAGEMKGINPGTNQISDTNYLNKLIEVDSQNGGNFYTDTDFFYGSKFHIPSRASKGAYNINGGGVAYYGAQEFLSQRSVKRQQMMDAFRNGLMFINEKCPYYFQSLSGLDQLLKVDIKNFHKPGSKPQRSGTLTVDCLESIDMRIFALSELYRKAIFDYTYHRTMLPENLRKFRMWVVVSEIRNIQLTYGINDVLNPFSIPSVGKAANALDSFNSQTGFLDQIQGSLQKSTNPLEAEDKFGSYTLGPYAFIYQLDQCEFDFDDSYPSFSSIDNRGNSSPVTNKFKIHVGRVKDYKIQFNELADVIKKDDNIKSMVLSDVWGSAKNDYADYDYKGSAGISSVDLSSKSNPKEYFAQMASNFITNTVADLKNQGVSILESSLLGNIYGMGGMNIGASTNSAQSLINTLKGGIPNPLADNKPQSKGLGGPSERQYPPLNEDVYPDSAGAPQQNLGNTYGPSGGVGNPNSILGDAYPNVPENPQYSKPGGDEYLDVSGKDLGVPDRIYPTINEDIYKDVPGKDLGGIERQYPKLGGDEYADVPGKDLGVPNRTYNTINEDVYPTVPGDDLGLPNRQYPQVRSDEYPSDNKVNTNNIGKIYRDPVSNYPNINDSEYVNPTGNSNTSIGDVYPQNNIKYPSVLDTSQYDKPLSKTPENIGGLYKKDEGKNDYPKNNSRLYVDNTSYSTGSNMGDVYIDKKNDYPSNNDRVYPDNKIYDSNGNMGDLYPTVPGHDLGAPSRRYGTLNNTEYKPIPSNNVTNIGRTYHSVKNENN
jgi:hypothetical protein